ncbi:hypothetical protein BDY19DRAFT_998115 [Irpex rosettiformis]|uniref:Uncharacterized protein n=1 Tax=Irpex rosettiformis TaxID=378272 RepID=A0ACB8TPJ5_9APHY|nr:hypothetical protein BDY19DRAFT_998115 [Irpex rosettiformis]
MSGLSESNIQQLLLEQTGNYIQFSAYALYFFDSCVTFSQEVDVIWGRKRSMMTWLYAFTRYSEVLLCITAFIPVWSWEANGYTTYILGAMQLLCLALFSALRVYALMDGKILVTGIVLFLNLVPVGTNLFGNVMSTIVMDISLGTRISVIIGDVLVLLVTWSKSAKLYHEARQLRIKAPLATLLFRDGTFYFIVLLMLNVLQVIDANIPSLSTMDVSRPFFETLQPLIVCRFILNLRQVKSAGSSWISGSQSGSLRFVGNAGESLQFGADEKPEEEEENTVEHLAEAKEHDVVDNGEDIADYDINFDRQPVSYNMCVDLLVPLLTDTSRPIPTGYFSARLVPSNFGLQG